MYHQKRSFIFGITIWAIYTEFKNSIYAGLTQLLFKGCKEKATQEKWGCSSPYKARTWMLMNYVNRNAEDDNRLVWRR